MGLELKIGLDAISSYRRLSYTPWHALAEFVDNSTQAYTNNQAELDRIYAATDDKLEVSVVYDPGNDLIMISDNSSGMNRDELQASLKIGNRPTIQTGRSRYGLGMKTAACWLGDHWTVRTKKLGETKEYTVTIDVHKVAAGDSDVGEQVTTGHAEEKHGTVIEIRKLLRKFPSRTRGKIKDFLRSMYRQDFRDKRLKLLWCGVPLEWEELDSLLLVAPDGNAYKKTIDVKVGGRAVRGWVGVLDNGSRAKAGFSILHSSRVVRGWPDAWRPSSLFGQFQGTNDLVNQRLVGEIHLDEFEVSHTKDDILWLGDEEESIETELEIACRDYREVAKKHRSRKADERGPSDVDTQTALDEIQRELSSPEIIDTLRLETVPSDDVVTQTFHAVIDAERAHPETFKVELDGITLRAYMAEDRSENDPYFVCDATRLEEVCVVINLAHPHWLQLSGSVAVANYIRHCVYDGLAEHMARHKKSSIQPDTIKVFKDKFLRLPLDIENAAPAQEDQAQETTS